MNPDPAPLLSSTDALAQAAAEQPLQQQAAESSTGLGEVAVEVVDVAIDAASSGIIDGLADVASGLFSIFD